MKIVDTVSPMMTDDEISALIYPGALLRLKRDLYATLANSFFHRGHEQWLGVQQGEMIMILRGPFIKHYFEESDVTFEAIHGERVLMFTLRILSIPVCLAKFEP